ncbi:MAG: DUF2259 domain-containing protein [Pseudomonadota bacterium]
MKRNCGFLFTSFMISMFLAVLPARSGYVSELNIIGFTENGSVFVYEEYGVQDGSGFPFARRHYIDTATDSYLPGMPIRVLLNDETRTVKEARFVARQEAESLTGLRDLDLIGNPGSQRAFNPVSEVNSDPHRVVFYPETVFRLRAKPLVLRLSEKRFPAPEMCSFATDQIRGFDLFLINEFDGGGERALNEDLRVPESRGCALGYKIGGVQVYYPEGEKPVLIALIIVERVGFEGSDFHWLAVAARPDEFIP